MPAQPPDRLPHGTAHRVVLDALESPTSVSGVALALGWDHDRARSWVHALRRAGRVALVGWSRHPRGQAAGLYARVKETTK